MSIVHEEWREVVGRDGYEVSSYGRVRSVERVILRRGFPAQMKGRILAQRKQNAGYMVVNLGLGYQKLVHRLVALAWIGNPPDGTEVNHIDGNKTNNRVENLEYVSRKQNMRHAQDTGLWDNRGEKNGRARNDEAGIRAGRMAVAMGMPVKDAAIMAGVTYAGLLKAVRGIKWRHLGLEPIAGRKSKRISDQIRGRVLCLRNDGMAMRDIAATIGIGIGSVHRICHG